MQLRWLMDHTDALYCQKPDSDQIQTIKNAFRPIIWPPACGMSATLWVIGGWDLPFDFAQGGEPVEPFVICYLVLGISLPDVVIPTACILFAKLESTTLSSGHSHTASGEVYNIPALSSITARGAPLQQSCHLQ